ncbi:hypothetical protein ABZ897_43130 [Nonomuraea sp. NPDC046802]|uniref:hypothetical protein n=1 Tax=Nonomuraea sp. NPDC046802 TaxID=3154919 RepID=UPI0033F37677
MSNPTHLPAKDVPKVLLGLVLERRLAGQTTAQSAGGPAQVTVTSPCPVRTPGSSSRARSSAGTADHPLEPPAS